MIKNKRTISETKYNEMNKIPIFILGRPRSGTTWIANIVSRNSKVASIQDQKYSGILESNFYSGIKPIFGNINNNFSYIKFLCIFFESEYFKLSNFKTLLANFLKFFA